MKSRHLLIVLAGFLTVFLDSSYGQSGTSATPGRAESFYPFGAVDPSVPTPFQTFGYNIGERFTEAYLIDAYVRRLADNSPRARIIDYGLTEENRSLRVLVISSPSNIQRIDQFRDMNLRLLDPRRQSWSQDVQKATTELPAIVWLSYGVHGNESSSSEAALAVAYQLIAGTDERTLSILNEAIVIIDPCLNPDGRDRYVRWYTSVGQKPPNVAWDAEEHSEPWPGGRTNHYYFDLNRDWAWLTQVESQQRVRLYREWMPHTHVDFHEMGPTSTYFFFPAAVPIHQSLPPEVLRWGEIYGRGNAAALDAIGAPYYVGERFDMFYPGYGDSWPTFNGAIGMTCEQAGSSRAGLALRRPNGTILTLRERARNHFLTSIATLETTVKHRSERIADFAGFWKSGLSLPDKRKAILVRADIDPPMAARLASTLRSHGIEVHVASKPASMSARPYYGRTSQTVTFAAGTLAIALEQPQRRLATVLLEPKSTVKDTFFYDVSAWSLPVAYGLDAFETEESLPGAFELSHRVSVISEKNDTIQAPYAYLIPWDRWNASKVVLTLLSQSTNLHVATKGFVLSGRQFSAGTVVGFVRQNSPALHQNIRRLSREHGVEIIPASTGLTEKGISLGSDYVQPIRIPSIALVTGDGISSNDAGELWYLLEKEFKVPFTALRNDDFGRVNLDKIDVLVFPNGYGWREILDSVATQSLRRWVSNGGVVVALEGAARSLTKSANGITPAALITDRKDDDKTKEEKEREKLMKERRRTLTRFEKEEEDRLERIPGTVFRVQIDTTHPIGFGSRGNLYVLKGNGIPFSPVDQGHVIARFGPDTVQTSGYISRERGRQVANSAYVQEFSIGRGKVILFSDTPTFRVMWLGTTRLFMNAILFSPPTRPF